MELIFTKHCVWPLSISCTLAAGTQERENRKGYDAEMVVFDNSFNITALDLTGWLSAPSVSEIIIFRVPDLFFRANRPSG